MYRLAKFQLLPITLVLVSTPVAAQSNRNGSTIELMSPPAIGRVGSQFWSSGGAGVAEDASFSAPFSNPASANPKSLTLSFEAGIRSTADWLFGSKYDGRWILPSYASLGIPGQDWSFSLGYANFYNLDLSIRDIPVTTENNPDGTGQTVDYERSVLAHTFFGSARYEASPVMSVGLTTGINVVSSTESLLELRAKGNGYGLVAIVGALFKPASDLNIGSSITFASTVNAEQRFFPAHLLQAPSGSYMIAAESYIYRTAFPWTAEVGIDWKLFRSAQLLASAEFQRWSGVNDGYENLWQFHLGTIISLVPGASIRLGFFTQKEPNSFSQAYMSENFLTMGFGFSVGDHAALSASVLDSHLFSSSIPSPSIYGPSHEFRQMSGSVGGSYSF